MSCTVTEPSFFRQEIYLGVDCHCFQECSLPLTGPKCFEFHSVVDKAFEVSSSLHPHSNPYGLG